MPTCYYKRFRMECDLTTGPVAVAELPDGYCWQCWRPGLEDRHAWVKSQSFEAEVDSTVFACLGQYESCLRLMRDISTQSGFLPLATWLVAASDPADPEHGLEDCGTIQAVALSPTLASIQNVGVVPEHRGRHLGRALVLKCLAGCQTAGIRRVSLEVTAGNRAAVELYRRIGFRVTRTMYRTVDLAARDVALS